MARNLDAIIYTVNLMLVACVTVSGCQLLEAAGLAKRRAGGRVPVAVACYRATGVARRLEDGGSTAVLVAVFLGAAEAARAGRSPRVIQEK